MKELRKTRCFKAVELKEYCKREPSVWKLMFIARPTPLLEQHPKQREILSRKKLYRVAPSPLCLSQSWWDISLELSSGLWERTHTSWLPPWEGWEHTSFLFHLAPCQSLWGPSKFFHRTSFPLTSATPVKPKFFIRILSLWFLTWWGKFLEILDSYRHTNIYFWVSVCISVTFWFLALHY